MKHKANLIHAFHIFSKNIKRCVGVNFQIKASSPRIGGLYSSRGIWMLFVWNYSVKSEYDYIDIQCVISYIVPSPFSFCTYRHTQHGMVFLI